MKLKSSVYPAISVGVFFLVSILVLQRWQIGISIELSDPTTASTPVALPIAISSTSIPAPTNANPPPANSQKSSPSLAASGVLRLNNQTELPVRIAFLPQSAPKAEQKAKAADRPSYDKPAHWDFAPGEGASKGLILSLSSGFVKPKPGDILIAFAQDGSRQYWGPYVVGSTPMPIWDRKTLEWKLILQP